MGLSFTIAAGPREHSHSRVRVPQHSWPYFTVSDSRLPQPGGPGPRIYIPQEKGGRVIPPGSGFCFLRLLRLAGLEWKYSNPPKSKSKSKLLYDCRFTANRFVMASNPLRPKTRDFFRLNPLGNGPYVTSSLTIRWVCLLWVCLWSSLHFAYITCYCKILPFALHTSPLSVQALESRSWVSYIFEPASPNVRKTDQVENTFHLLLRAYSLQRERVYPAVVYERSLFSRLISRSLHNNGCTRYRILHSVPCLRITFHKIQFISFECQSSPIPTFDRNTILQVLQGII
jgi:hypothetical protein